MSTPSIQNNPLIGIWKLISQRIQPDGTINSEVYGTHPVGYITYIRWSHDGNVFQERSPTAESSSITAKVQSLPLKSLLKHSRHSMLMLELRAATQ